MQKNTAGKWVVYAWTTATGLPKTGDAAQITANVRIDGAGANAVDDTNPAELEDGYYIFDITAAECNGDNVVICPASSTSGVQVIGCPAAVWTRPPNFQTMSIDSNGRLDVIKVAGTTQTARDIGASVLLSSGTGTGQISLSSGAVLLQATQTGVTIPTVTTLTNLPAITSNWLTAAGLAADAVTEIQTGLATAAALDTIDNFLDTEIAAILEDTGTTLDALIKDIPTVAEFEARTIAAGSYFDPAADVVAHVTLVDTTTTNTDMRGTDGAALASAYTSTRAGYLDELAAANIPADIDGVKTIANKLDTALELDGAVYRYTTNAL